MFEKFGEFGSYKKINELAENLKTEGDKKSIRVLAKENGLDGDIAEAFIEGDIGFLCDPVMAAMGKIEVEAAELKPQEIMADWVEYLRGQCFEDEAMALAVRKEGKTLKGMVAGILKWSFAHQITVDKEIIKEAKISASRVTIGEPGMAKAKELIREYYLGGGK